MQRSLWLCGVLLALPLAGCMGQADQPVEALKLKSRADVTPGTGGIQGVVTNPVIQPIEGVAVIVLETNARVATASDGSYAFSNVAPGRYTLVFAADRFIASQLPVDVRPNEVATVDAILAPFPKLVPFSQQFEFGGFVECSVSTPLLSAAACAMPSVLLGLNVTNDKFLFPFDIEPDPWQLVAELEWTPSQPLASTIFILVEPRGLPNDPQTEYGRAEGPSPLIVSADRARIQGADGNMTDICSGAAAPADPVFSAGAAAYCRAPYVEEGGPMWVRTFVSSPEPSPVGVAVQQEYHLIVTSFHHAAACPGYSALLDELCVPEGAGAVRPDG